MDGNGRWAQARGLSRSEGHAAGAESLRATLRAAKGEGIEYLSFYTFSSENWKRSAQEVGAIMSLMSSNITEAMPEFLDNKIRFRVIGDRASLSESLVKQIEEAEKATEQFTELTMVLLFSYSGKWDIEQAAERYAQARARGVDAPFESYLATAGIPDPDLLIRTGGERRISNYMLWQCAYTELYFTEKLWPDFREDDFRIALDDFRSRDRRYGRVK